MTAKKEMIEDLMREALRLATQGTRRVSPNPMTGALILHDGKIVGRGRHECCGGPHAEVNAIRDAGDDVRGCEMVVTLEPCCHKGKTPPCTDLIIYSGIKKVYMGMIDPNPLVAGKGVRQLRDAGIEVITGILEESCRALNQPFIKMMTRDFPYIIAKAAITLDGYVADVNKNSKWISSPESRAIVHKMRAACDAVMVGMGTVIADDPALTVRDAVGDDTIRMVYDPRGSLSEQSKLVQSATSTPLYVMCSPKSRAEWKKSMEVRGVVLIACGDLEDGLRQAGKMGIQSVLVEGGGILHRHLAAADLVDRLELFIAPKLLGSGTPMMKIPDRLMPDASIFLSHRWEQSGPDMHFSGIIKNYE